RHLPRRRQENDRGEAWAARLLPLNHPPHAAHGWPHPWGPLPKAVASTAEEAEARARLPARALASIFGTKSSGLRPVLRLWRVCCFASRLTSTMAEPRAGGLSASVVLDKAQRLLPRIG